MYQNNKTPPRAYEGQQHHPGVPQEYYERANAAWPFQQSSYQFGQSSGNFRPYATSQPPPPPRPYYQQQYPSHQTQESTSHYRWQDGNDGRTRQQETSWSSGYGYAERPPHQSYHDSASPPPYWPQPSQPSFQPFQPHFQPQVPARHYSTSPYNGRDDAGPSRHHTSNPPSRPASPPRHPQRKIKTPRARPTGSPSEAYLKTVLGPCSDLVPSSSTPAPLLVLDLNHTLLHRYRSSSSASTEPTPRPYLSTFLAYITRQWSPAVYSSARAKNVLSMLAALELVPNEAVYPYVPKRGDGGEPLVLVWAREDMKLAEWEFRANVETVKNLAEVWDKLEGGWGPKRTVLLDDEKEKVALQPYNHLPIEGFFMPPRSPSPSPARSPRRSPSLPPEIPDDEALLSTIAHLHVLRRKSNIASFVRAKGLVELQAKGEEALVQEGRRICGELGIKVAREWDKDWKSW